ncbi:MAG: hypothetical protein HZB33_15580 [Nitrospirae bacterium]|nr:hypothetical protein [Nitrospirota bacterium]
MRELRELIRQYGLQEDLEHIIIPLRGKYGSHARCFLLKRKFIRIVYPDGHCVDYPLEEVIEATIKYPDLMLSESLPLLHEEMDAEITRIFGDEKEGTV